MAWGHRRSVLQEGASGMHEQGSQLAAASFTDAKGAVVRHSNAGLGPNPAVRRGTAHSRVRARCHRCPTGPPTPIPRWRLTWFLVASASHRFIGAGEGTRTLTIFLPADFESAASTSSATPARALGNARKHCPAFAKTSLSRKSATAGSRQPFAASRGRSPFARSSLRCCRTSKPWMPFATSCS